MFGAEMDSTLEMIYAMGIEMVRSEIEDLEQRKRTLDRKIAGYRRIEGVIKKFRADQVKSAKQAARRQRLWNKQARNGAKRAAALYGAPVATVAPPLPRKG